MGEVTVPADLMRSMPSPSFFRFSMSQCSFTGIPPSPPSTRIALQKAGSGLGKNPQVPVISRGYWGGGWFFSRQGGGPDGEEEEREVRVAAPLSPEKRVAPAVGPPFSWQCLPGAPSSNSPSLLQSPGEEAGNKRQHEEVQGPGLCPLPRSEHLCAFCVLPPRWGLASLEDRRNVSQLLPHCAPSWVPVLTPPPPARATVLVHAPPVSESPGPSLSRRRGDTHHGRL